MGRTSALRCPACGIQTPEEMPDSACLYFWECPACKVIVTPKAGDCCVFCSHGPEQCPPKASSAIRR
jgi:hypothetical protein